LGLHKRKLVIYFEMPTFFCNFTLYLIYHLNSLPMKSKNEEKLVMFINGMLVEVLLLETSQIAHQAPSVANCVKSSQR